MALEIKRLKNLPIGVDLGTSMLKLAQLRTGAGGVELQAAGSAEIPRGLRDSPRRRLSHIGGQIQQMLKRLPFKGRKAILSLPSAHVFLQPVRVPLGDGDQLERAVRQELASKLPYSVEDAIVRHVLAGHVYDDRKELQERIVIAVGKRDVEQHMAMARRAGLHILGVNVEACAIIECFGRLFSRQADESRVTLFVDIGSTSTQVVLAHGPRMVFARNLAVGGGTLDRAVAEKLNISIEQAHAIGSKLGGQEEHSAAEDDLFRLLGAKIGDIAGEVTQCLRYHESIFQNRGIEQVVFVGGQAHNNRLCQTIAQRLNLPAQVGDPLAGIRRAPESDAGVELDTRRPLPAWAVAVGLSLGANLAA